jgi:hypothetical protein
LICPEILIHNLKKCELADFHAGHDAQHAAREIGGSTATEIGARLLR